MRTILLVGDRLFLKFPSFDYFHERVKEIDAQILSTAGMSDTEIEAAAVNASAFIVIGRPITAGMINACRNCEFIMTMSVGYDVVDLPAATARGIPVSNCPLYCSEEVAEHALTLVLALRRKVFHFDEHVRGGGYDYKQARPIHNWRSTTYGIIGLGRIGRYGARKAAALGMKVIAYDPYVDDDVFRMLGVERKYDLEPLLQESDAITVHSPLTDETWHMMNRQAFRQMKPTGVIVNTARGGIIDRTALEEALAEGVIAGAGIDVLETEPPGGDEPLLSLPNVILTPHIAWYSEQSHQQNLVDGMDELVRVLQGKRPRYVVNPQIYARRQSGQ